jgi:CHAD domain-containing protein/adenylate cyclase class IV
MKSPTETKEIEYKFLLPEPGANVAVLGLLGSKGYKIQRLRTIQQDDLYLDTFDWRLFRRGISVRIRRANGKLFYTLKSIEKFEDGRAERREIEVAVNTADPSVSNVKEIQAEIADIIRPRKLIEQLTVRTERQPYMITTPGNAKIELVFDATGFLARGFNRPRRTRRLFEMEAEIRKGTLAELDALRDHLAAAMNLIPSDQSKLETAIERLGILFPAKNPPRSLQVNMDDRFDQAVQKILAFQIQRIDENIPGVLADIDTEFVHQARVATRRMRSLIRLFGGAIPEITGARFSEELLWMGALFGDVRDLDVFLLNLPRFKQSIEVAPQRAIDTLTSQIEKEREVHLENLKSGLASSRWNQLRAQILAFAGRPPAKNPSAPLASLPLHTAAPPIITERFDAVIAQGNRVLAEPDLDSFHKLRIQFKRLRYALEFVGPAYGNSLHPLIAEVVKVQDCLGDLQDTVFTRSLINRLLKKWKGSVLDPRMLFMLGEMYALQGEIARTKQAEFTRIWKRFDQDSLKKDLVSALGRG